MAAKKENAVEIQIKPVEIKKARICIVGDTPIIVHAWSEKAKRMMLEAQQGKAKAKKKEVRDPFNDFVNSMYWITEKPDFEGKTEEEERELFEEAIRNGAKFGFPVTAIKMAANSTAYRLGWVKNQMALRASYFIESDYGELGWIEGEPPILREDMVRIGMGSADLRYRAEFRNWKMHFNIVYNASGDIALEQIINCINAGGFANGCGEWRPEKDGNFGKFHVESN